MRDTPMRGTLNERHAYERHIYEKHAYERHAYERHTYERHAYETSYLCLYILGDTALNLGAVEVKVDYRARHRRICKWRNFEIGK